VTVTIYHNPRCSKSRQTLELIREQGIEPEIVAYLDTPPDAGTLGSILARLGLTPLDLMRTGEAEYKEAREQLEAMNGDARIKWLCAHPRVMQRPIVIAGDAARIGRPPEAVLDILAT